MPPENMKETWNAPITVFMGDKELKMTNNLTFELQREKASKPYPRKHMIARARRLLYPRHRWRKLIKCRVALQITDSTPYCQQSKNSEGTLVVQLLNGDLAKVGMPCLD